MTSLALKFKISWVRKSGEGGRGRGLLSEVEEVIIPCIVWRKHFIRVPSRK